MSRAWLVLGLLLALLWPVAGAATPTELETAEALALARPHDGAGPARPAGRRQFPVPNLRRARPVPPRRRARRSASRPGWARPLPDAPPGSDDH
jgi:hypothetical protein